MTGFDGSGSSLPSSVDLWGSGLAWCSPERALDWIIGRLVNITLGLMVLGILLPICIYHLVREWLDACSGKE